MLYASTTSLLLIIGCVLFHYEALRFIGASAARVKQHRRAVLTVIFGVVGAHLAEILLYALAMYLGHTLGLGALVGEPHPRPAQYFYLSAETFTTLGLGDIYPTGDLRLIASLEPLIGMLLIGWSGSYTYLAVQRYWVDLQIPTRATTRRERARITGPRQRKRRSLSPAATNPDH
ncbi:MAG: two pore domain potassium channel family protein [Gammaproteobacteria bacterium]|nr:two pore domain potassium channel family protein [Gammaproteobacteria bacterium]